MKKSNNTVVIVGRMNVGKSTLFNRLSKKVKSITLDYQGVTRDFLKDRVEWKGKTFEIIDSGGIDLKKSDDLLFVKMREKVLDLVKEADVVVFLTDGTVGVLQEDMQIARFLHTVNKPVILAINKIDTHQAQSNVYEFNSLGFAEIVPIAAEHGRGIDDLEDAIIDKLPETSLEAEGSLTTRVVFLGKPNVGKSSLMNVLLGEERTLVSDIAGTTREAVSENIMFYKEAIQVTDTPGIRRMRSVSGQIEPLMVKSSFQALRQSDVVVLLIDGSQKEIVDQELKLAFYSFTEQYKALVILVNKEDLMTEEIKESLKESFIPYQHLMKKISLLYISCKTGKNIGKILPLLNQVGSRHKQTFSESDLTSVLLRDITKKVLYKHGVQLEVRKVKQIKTAPITIELKVNDKRLFEPFHLQYFEKVLRANYDLNSVPVKFVLK